MTFLPLIRRLIRRLSFGCLNLACFVFFTSLVCASNVFGEGGAFLQPIKLEVTAIVPQKSLSQADPRDAPASSKKAAVSNAQVKRMSDARDLKRLKITQMTAKRIKKRLLAAGIKDAHAVAGSHGKISITVYGAFSRRWIEQVVFGPGRLDVRVIMDKSMVWQELEGMLPKGIKLKAHDMVLEPWSMDREVLERFVSKLAMPGVRLLVARGTVTQGYGWRVIALEDESIVTQRDVQAAQMNQGVSGRTFLSVALRATGVARWSALNEKVKLAFVLDEEVLSVLSARSLRAGQFTVQCPLDVRDLQEHRLCVGQIAGRMAATIPVPLIRTHP